MDLKGLFKRLRGALGIATVWGGIWTIGGLAALLLLPGGASVPLAIAIRMALRLGFSGFILGGVFSAVLSHVYRDRTLLDIKTGWFTLLGGVVAAPFWPGAFLMAGALGALSAWTSIGLAKSAAEELPSGSDKSAVAMADGKSLPDVTSQ